MATAQPVLHATEFSPPIGHSWTYLDVDYESLGPAENNFTLDLSSLVGGTATATVCMAPSATPYAGNFPEATHAWLSDGMYNYYKETDSTLEMLGAYDPIYGIQLEYTDPQVMAAFPLSLGEEWMDQDLSTMDMMGDVSTYTGTLQGTYTGYGTLILPYGTYTNVARVYTTYSYEQESTATGHSNWQTHHVSYIKTGLPVALFTVDIVLSDYFSGDSMDTVVVSGSMLDPVSVSIAEEARSLGGRLVPNPARDMTELLLDHAARPGARVELLDATGRVLQTRAVPTGFQRVPLELGSLPQGVYLVRASDASSIVGSWRLTIE